jgi:hypothetical protein
MTFNIHDWIVLFETKSHEEQSIPGDIDGKACLRARNWRGRDHGSIMVSTVGLPPI